MDDRETLSTRLVGHHETRGGRIFAHFVQPEREVALTWSELYRGAVRFAALVEKAAIPPRETVFILAPLGPDLLAAFLGVMLARAVPALLSYPSSKVAPDVYSKNLRGVLEVTGARFVLTTKALEEPLARALEGSTGKRVLWIEETPAASEADVARFASAVKEVPPSEVAFLQHSSGSTGLQKGVALSHGAVLAQVRHYAKALALDPERDHVASWLPLYHDMGLIATFLLPLATGTRVCFLDPFRWVTDPVLLLEAVARHRSTLCWLPNFAYVHMAKRIAASRTAGLDLSSVRAFVNCSEPVRHESHRLFLDRFAANGVKPEMLWVCYAMAENTFAVTQAGGGVASRVDWVDAAKLASERRAEPVAAGSGIPMVSCGEPIEGCEVRIVDERREPLADRSIGEVALRSDSMLTEYHNNAEATATALEGGFYFTGDLGYRADGHLYITGRKKDLIIVGGRNFYPQDLEDVASAQEGIIPGRAVAFGLENEALGTEEVVIVAETELASPEAIAVAKKAIQRAALERLDCAVGKVELVPRGWIVKTSSGKVARKANVEKYLAERASLAKTPEPAAPAPVAEAPAPRDPLALLALQIAVAAAIILLAIVLRPNEALVLYQGF